METAGPRHLHRHQDAKQQKGTADTANELRFEDKKDSEYIWLNAEKDFYRIVEHDAFDHIGNNETVKVVLTRKEVIGENWFMDITKDVMHNMGKDLHVNVAGDIFYTGGATFQLKLTKDLNAHMDGDLGIDVGGKAQLKAQQRHRRAVRRRQDLAEVGRHADHGQRHHGPRA